MTRVLGTHEYTDITTQVVENRVNVQLGVFKVPFWSENCVRFVRAEKSHIYRQTLIEAV